MNTEYLVRCAERIKRLAERRFFDYSPAAMYRVGADAETIVRELKSCGWKKRDQGDKINGRRYLCRYVYESVPEYPVYMVLTWNAMHDVPHFDNEQDGVMRVTHWAEIDVPEGEKA